MSGNPFQFNLPVGADQFVGRMPLVAEIADDLQRYAGDSYGVVGGRRFGKSSLLLALRQTLLSRLKVGGDERPELFVLPVYCSLKAVGQRTSERDVLGFILHALRKGTSGPNKKLPLVPRLPIDLGLPVHTATDPVPATIQQIEAAVGDVAEAAQACIGDLRLALLIDEIDEALGQGWTPTLFGNLRSLVYDSDFQIYVRIVLAGSPRFLDVNETGSTLSNALKTAFLEPLSEPDMQCLTDRAPGLSHDARREILLQAGGHPFIAQHVLHYLYASRALADATVATVRTEVARFSRDRHTDLTTWWKELGSDAQQAYAVLSSTDDWIDVATLAARRQFDVQRSLRILSGHGVVAHDGGYERYRSNGRLFRDWSAPHCAHLKDASSEPPRSAWTKNRREDLARALLSALHNLASVEEVVSYGLDERLDTISGSSNRQTAIFQLIEWAIAHGRVYELIGAARERVPRNELLRRFAATLGLVPRIKAAEQLDGNDIDLEAIVNDSAGFTDVELWLARMSDVMLSICRIEIPSGSPAGTGFLIGPSTVLTNYHVIRPVKDGTWPPAQLRVRFDYRTDATGKAIRQGKEYGLAANWLLDSSVISELDYAVLRLDGRPGDDEAGGQVGAAKRQFLTPLQKALEEGQPLFVVQHPSGRPLTVAVDVVVGLTATRVRYRTNTEFGSSGSPVFTDSWELVALHQGFTKSSNQGIPASNQGIPFAALLAKPELVAALGK